MNTLGTLVAQESGDAGRKKTRYDGALEGDLLIARQ
jgi:hypothetical protein